MAIQQSEAVKTVIFAEAYKGYTYSDDDAPTYLGEIRNRFFPELSLKYMKSSADMLGSNLIISYDSEIDDYSVSVTTPGISNFEGDLLKPSTNIYQFMNSESAWLKTNYIPPKSLATNVPASDRIVKRSDNEDAWANSAEGVIALREAMSAANDYGELDAEEFEQRLSEVRALEIMLNAPQVQWSVLDQFATNTIKYLATKFADNAIGLAASALIGYLGALLKGAF